jgi:sugar lactone lactonase YvrE
LLVAGLRFVRLARARGLCVLLAGVFLFASAVRGQSASMQLMRPAGVAYDASGDLFIADADRNQVVEISSGGVASVVAGNGTQGFTGDGGSATAAELNSPMAVAVGSDGTLYIADTGNQRIRAVRAGAISTFAGSGVRGFSGDGGAATAAALNRPVALAVDAGGALLVCDQGNERVRRISNGQIATVAGNGTQGFTGDGAAATAAELNEPSGVAVSADGRVFIADTGNQRVRVVASSGVISTFAGTGVAGFGGDGGPAVAARLNRPAGLAVDDASELYVADENNQRLRRIGADGTIATLAGSGVQGAAADGAVAMGAAENQPGSVAVSSFGWPVIADASDGNVRLVFSDGRLYAPAGMSTRTTTVMPSAPNAVYGQAQASLTVAGSPAVPQGMVQILEGATVLASGTIAQGAAAVSLPTLGAGTHTLTALYAGDGLHPGSSATTTVIVTPAPVTAAATAATVSYGAPLPTLMGTLSGVLPQDQGSVTAVFSADAAAMAAVGSYPITAALTGSASANYTLSMAANSGAVTVVPAATLAKLTQPPGAYAGLPLQLNATVASTTSGMPTGSVEFLDGGSVIATAPLVNGSASAVDLSVAAGAHTFSVAYSGDANFHASTSANVLEAVNAMPDFTVATAGSTQQTVVAGSAATFALTVASQGTPFTGAVMMSASGLPSGASASFSPTAVVPGASSAPVTMTVTTSTLSASRGSALPELALSLAGLMFIVTRKRRGAVQRLLAGIVLAGILGLSGCGARSAPESVLPVQSYSIVVKATATNLAANVVEHTVGVTLSVE